MGGAMAWEGLVHMKKILVVDDNQNFRQLMDCLFQDHCEVLEAEDGRKGLETARSVRPELILTDVMMPEMSGLELVRELNSGDTRGIPVLVLTGSHFDSGMEQVFSQEGNVRGFLPKGGSTLDILKRALEILSGT